MSFCNYRNRWKTVQSYCTSKILEIEKLNAKIGETIKFTNVLLLNDNKDTEVGNPNIDGATVEAKLLDNVKDKTILVFQKKKKL